MLTTAVPHRGSIRIRWRGLELPTRIEFEKSSLTDCYGRVIAEPFERGYGTTIGNSLRRVLLSSLEGCAVTHIQIKDVEHEFMTIRGVYEDVSQIILNIKRLLLRIEGDEPVTLHVKRTEPGKVTGADIKVDHRTEVVTKDLVICELTSSAEFELKMWARRGRGYLSASDHETEEQIVGVIPIDSIFSPVTRVRYRTEDTRVGKMTNYDKLVLEIWTDGTVTPSMALVEAGKILRKHINPFVQSATLGEELHKPPSFEPTEPVVTSSDSKQELREKLKMTMSQLDLSVRASNCLMAESITTVGELVQRTEDDMLLVRNFGKTSLKEIKKKLSDMGLSLGMDVDGLID